MRIIGGEWRGRKIEEPRGRDVTRPTTDRVREACASMVMSAFDFDLDEVRVLDAFGGSGALGIEMLSRGARSLTTFEIDRNAARLITKNIESLCRDRARWRVVTGDVLASASRGRVGRGSVSGTCLVMTHSKGNGVASAAQDRLQSLEKTSDGFTLAQMDLRLRHEGEILGYRQHGGVTLRFVDLDADEELIEWAHLDAVELLRYACNLDSVATRPLRDAVAMRYRHIFKEVSGG